MTTLNAPIQADPIPDRAARLASFREARRRGVAWLLRHINADGSIGDPSTGFSYYRAPWAFKVVGETEAAAATSAWIRRNLVTADGRIDGPYRVFDEWSHIPRRDAHRRRAAGLAVRPVDRPLAADCSASATRCRACSQTTDCPTARGPTHSTSRPEAGRGVCRAGSRRSRNGAGHRLLPRPALGLPARPARPLPSRLVAEPPGDRHARPIRSSRRRSCSSIARSMRRSTGSGAGSVPRSSAASTRPSRGLTTSRWRVATRTSPGLVGRAVQLARGMQGLVGRVAALAADRRPALRGVRVPDGRLVRRPTGARWPLASSRRGDARRRDRNRPRIRDAPRHTRRGTCLTGCNRCGASPVLKV